MLLNRLVVTGCFCVWVCMLTHAELTSLLVCIFRVWCCIPGVFFLAYRMLCISLFRVLWTGSGRPWGFLWKRNTTLSCLEVLYHLLYSLCRAVLFCDTVTTFICVLLNLSFRSDRVTVFSAAVSIVASNGGSVRPPWQKTLTHPYHSE